MLSIHIQLQSSRMAATLLSHRITLMQGRIFLTSFLSRDEAFSGIASRMKLLGHAIETLSPPSLDTQTAMLIESSDARKSIARAGGGHRRSLSLGGAIDLSVQNDAASAVDCADDADTLAGTAVVAGASVTHSALELRALAEVGSSAADVAVDAAVAYVAATSPFALQLSRFEQLLSAAYSDDLQCPCVSSSHVSPLVDLRLPVSVQEFFLCFISDDHHFNTKVCSTQPLCSFATLHVHHLYLSLSQYHAALNNFSISSTPWQAADAVDTAGSLSSQFEWKQKAKSGLGRYV